MATPWNDEVGTMNDEVHAFQISFHRSSFLLHRFCQRRVEDSNLCPDIVGIRISTAARSTALPTLQTQRRVRESNPHGPIEPCRFSRPVPDHSGEPSISGA